MTTKPPPPSTPPPTDLRLPPVPKHVLLGITGSVAAVKGPELAVSLARNLRADVIVLLTRGATNFWDESVAGRYGPTAWRDLMGMVVEHGDGGGIQSFMVGGGGDGGRGGNGDGGVGGPEGSDGCGGKIMLVKADDEWNGWSVLGDPVLHIQLRDWADILVIAPLSAHTLGKISNGLCDDTLTCVVRAWDFANYNYDDGNSPRRRRPKPLVLAPAMNTAMWTHPLTRSQLTTVRGFWTGGGGTAATTARGTDGRGAAKDETDGAETTAETAGVAVGSGEGRGTGADAAASSEPCPVRIVQPQVKTLACGDTGAGAMANVGDVVAVASSCLGSD